MTSLAALTVLLTTIAFSGDAAAFIANVEEDFSTVRRIESRAEQAKACADLVRSAFDVAGMARSVAADEWSRASANERTRIVAAVAQRVTKGCVELSRRAYAENGRIMRIRELQTGAAVTVLYNASRGRRSTFRWHLVEGDNGWHAIDLSVNGRSVASRIRAEFNGAMKANRNDLDAALAEFAM